MDESRYLQLVDQALERAANWLEEYDPDDVDFSTTDGVVTIEFPCGTRFVLNRQRAANQIWFAAGVEAWHYTWNDDSNAWNCVKDGHELFANMRRYIEAKLLKQSS